MGCRSGASRTVRAVLLASAAWVAAGAGCKTSGAGAGPASKGSEVIETIEETTVGDLAGTACPMANMGVDTYALPDGATRTGLTATLYPGEEGFHRVGVGSVVEIGGRRWECIDVSKPPGQRLGTVTLRLLDAAAGAPAGGGAGALGEQGALDYGYESECTLCGTRQGWTGRVEVKELLGRVDRFMVFRCPRCELDGDVYFGEHQAALRAGTLRYVPGRGPA